MSAPDTSAANNNTPATRWIHGKRPPQQGETGLYTDMSDSETTRMEAEDARWAATMEGLRQRVLEDPKYAPEVLIRNQRLRNQRARRKVQLAVAASVLGVAFTLTGLFVGRDRVQAWDRFQNTTGETSPRSLADGSVVLLNRGAEVRVNRSEATRLVVLDSGEAFFDVRSDALRPFDVEAGPFKVHAVGTAFSVKKDEDGQIETAVRRGYVQVEFPGNSPPASGAGSPNPQVGDSPDVKEGQVATIGPDGKMSVITVGQAALAERLAWADPLQKLDGMTLRDAVDLFNRYNVLQLVVKDEELGRIPVSGGFHLAEPEKFVEALQTLGVSHMLLRESSTNARILLQRQ